MVTPIRMDLKDQPLQAKVDLAQAVDGDGFYYREGDYVEISADQTIKKLTSDGIAFGQLDSSIHEDSAPEGLEAAHRVAVLTKYRQLTTFISEGPTVAGENLISATTTPGQLKVASNIAVKAGATPVTSDAANGEILEGSVLPEEILGKCWIGATDGNEGQILI